MIVSNSRKLPAKKTSTFNPSSFSLSLFFHSLQPSWTWKITPHLTHTLTFSLTYRSNAANTPDIFFNENEWQIGGREELKLKISQNFTLLMGTDAHEILYTGAARVPFFLPYPQFPSPQQPFPPLRDLKGQESVLDWGVYVEGDYRWQKLRLIPGLRLEEITYAGRMHQSLQPRFTARYDLNSHIALKAATGIYQKYPPLQNIALTIGNPDLGLENAWQTSVGFEWQITQALSLDTTGFYNYLWDQSSPSTATRLIGKTLQPLYFENNQRGRIVGLEVWLRHHPYKNFFGWIAYTLSRSERINPTTPTWFLFSQDQTHILTLIASYIFPYNIQLGARFRVVSGNPTTPIRGAVYDSDTGSYLPLNGAVRSARLPLFHQLDLRIDKFWVFNRWRFSLYLDIQNVYNQKNPEFITQSYDFSQSQYFTGLPILPVIGIGGEF